jgi:ATP-dependent protease HslVU (ClpYQ) peptidase subunit
MSVVVWDGITLAADRQATSGEMRVTTRKIKRLSDGSLAGWTGASEYGQLLVEWYERGQDRDKWPAFQRTDKWARLIVVRQDGVVLEFEQEPIAQPVLDVPMAWGSGRDIAIGALEMGATAIQAVEIACRYNVYCGGA